MLSAGEVASRAVQTLGLDHEVVELTSTEGLAASLRRAASFLCPTTHRQLVNAVFEAIRPLSADDLVTRDQLVELLDLLIASGDLLELREEADRTTRLLFLGPPSYIERQPGEYLLLGVRPFGAPLVDPELNHDVQHESHTRNLELDPETAVSWLLASGLQEISRQRWVAGPSIESAAELVERLCGRLAATGAAGEIENLSVLDPAAPVRFYRGRWRAPKAGDSGDFVARRPQAYGADLWCFVRLGDEAPKHLMDFPIDDLVVPGRDEAWRLQAALDELRGRAQQYRVRPAAGGARDRIIEFFSPLPGFADRYLELVGLALPRAPGSLFSFRVPIGAIPALEALLADMLWMQATGERGSE